jgi:hypothetical protein
MCRTSAIEARQQFLADYDQRLQQLSDDQPLEFPKLSQFDELLYPLRKLAGIDANARLRRDLLIAPMLGNDQQNFYFSLVLFQRIPR